MNNNKLTWKYSLSDQGGEQLIRATLVCELMADLMSHQGSSNQKMVSALGVSALFECLAGQLDGAIDESILLSVTKIKGKIMLSINHPASPEFKVALLRHYISCAFIDSMTSKNGQAVFIEDGEVVALTLDKVALNIIYHIEAPYIEQFGVMDGGLLAAADLMAMLAPGFMIAQVQLSHYGYHRLCEVYRDIIFGAPDGELPPGATLCACNAREVH